MITKIKDIKNNKDLFNMIFIVSFSQKKIQILFLSIILIVYSYYNQSIILLSIFILILLFIYIFNYLKYNKVYGLCVYPNYIFILVNNLFKIKDVNYDLLYDYVLNHELKHLEQFKTIDLKNIDIDNLELEADNHSLNMLKYKYSKDELNILTNFLSKS